MYLVGAPHPNRELLATFLRHWPDEDYVTSAEVYQEMMHRFVAIDRRAAIEDAFRLLDDLVVSVFPDSAKRRRCRLGNCHASTEAVSSGLPALGSHAGERCKPDPDLRQWILGVAGRHLSAVTARDTHPSTTTTRSSLPPILHSRPFRRQALRRTVWPKSSSCQLRLLKASCNLLAFSSPSRRMGTPKTHIAGGAQYLERRHASREGWMVVGNTPVSSVADTRWGWRPNIWGATAGMLVNLQRRIPTCPTRVRVSEP